MIRNLLIGAYILLVLTMAAVARAEMNESCQAQSCFPEVYDIQD